MTPHQAWLYPHVVRPYRARRYGYSAGRTLRFSVLTMLAAVASVVLVVAVAPIIPGW